MIRLEFLSQSQSCHLIMQEAMFLCTLQQQRFYCKCLLVEHSPHLSVSREVLLLFCIRQQDPALISRNLMAHCGKDCTDLKQQANISSLLSLQWITTVVKWLSWIPLAGWRKRGRNRKQYDFFFFLWNKQEKWQLRQIGINATQSLGALMMHTKHISSPEGTVHQRIDYCFFETRAIQVWACLKCLLETSFWVETFRDNLSHRSLPTRAKG